MPNETKHVLNKADVKDILSFIKPLKSIPNETAVALARQTVKKLKKQLLGLQIYKEKIPELKRELKELYRTSLIQPGECVGILCAQSIGEKQTQSNLNTFHKAGSSDRQPVTSKFSELLNGSKEPKAPSTLIYFKDGKESIADLRQTVGHEIVMMTFGRITKEEFVISINKKPEAWYPAYKMLYGDEFEEYTDCITINVDMDVLFEYKITLKEIAEFITEEYDDMHCVHSPDCFGQLDLFVDTSNIDLPEQMLKFVTQDNTQEIYLEEVVVPLIRDIPFCGIQGVDNMFFMRDDTGGWMIETENSFKNLNESIATFKKILAHNTVDMTRTVSNNVWDIYHTLGVEAAREFMIEEYSRIMTGINLCHVMLLVDKQTHGGTIASISRYTMRREESGPFGKASFEETLDNFLKAGGTGQDEPTKGVSASIICGKRAPIGTGLCSLKMDLDMLSTIEEE